MEDYPHKVYRLNNVMFPVYMLFLLFPQVWAVVLPFNFAFDSLVLCLAMRHFRYPAIKMTWKASILRIWGFGFLADLLGAGLINLLYFLMESVLDFSDFMRLEFLFAAPGVLLAGWLIYIFDKRRAFGKTALTPAQRHRLALALAIFTAPYTMLIPTAWLY